MASVRPISNRIAPPLEELRSDPPIDKIPWLAAAMCLIFPVLPTIVVLPGPLRGNGSPARMIGYTCAALVLLAFLARRRCGNNSRFINPGILIIVGYFFLQFLTYATGVLDHRNAVIESSKTRTMLGFVVMVGLTLYVIDTVRTRRQRSIVLGCLITGLTYACLVGLLQNFKIIDLRYTLVPPGFVRTAEDIEVASRGGALRAVGTSSHAIEYSVLAAVALLLAIHAARFAERRLSRQLAALAGLIAFLSVPASVSRSGVVVVAVALLIYILSMKVRAIGNVVFIGVAGLLAQKIVSPGSLNALWSTILGSSDDNSISERTGDYAAVGAEFRQHPWFGLGLGGYPPTEYRFLDNQWLQAVVQGGVVGIAAMVLLLVGGVAGMTWGLHQARTPRERDLMFVCGAAYVGIIASSFTFDLFSFQQATYLLFILFALLWSIRPEQDPNLRIVPDPSMPLPDVAVIAEQPNSLADGVGRTHLPKDAQ